MNEDQLKELTELMEENLRVSEDNNRLLRLIRRDAMLGLVAKVILWAVLLGLPLLLLGSYIGPIMDALTGAAGAAPGGATGAFGFPSPEQAQELMEQYKELYEAQ